MAVLACLASATAWISENSNYSCPTHVSCVLFWKTALFVAVVRPLLLAGDFNSTPESAVRIPVHILGFTVTNCQARMLSHFHLQVRAKVYEYLRNAYVSEKHEASDKVRSLQLCENSAEFFRIFAMIHQDFWAGTSKEQHEDATFVIRVGRTALSTLHHRFRIHMRHDLELITAYEKCTGGRPGFFRNACSVLSQVSQLNYLLIAECLGSEARFTNYTEDCFVASVRFQFLSIQQLGEHQWFNFKKWAQSKFVSPILNSVFSRFSGIILLHCLMWSISYYI